MIFFPHCQYAAAALGVTLLVGCSVTAPTVITAPAAIPQSIPTTPITQSNQSTSTEKDSPSFIKVVDAKHNPSLCFTANMHSEVLSQVNQFRAQGAVCGGVRYPPAKPLRWSIKLQQAADTHSHDMATHNYFNHKSASNGSTLIERLHSVNYNYRAAGENIGAGPATVAQVIDMWVASPAHCVTMMTAHFAELGVSCKNNNNSQYKTYWTLNAAAPF
jgi:uncharacterized protein YkwD